MPGEVTVISISMKDCYEMAMGELSPFADGKEGESYMRVALESAGFTPKVVTPEAFKRLLKDALPPDLPAPE